MWERRRPTHRLSRPSTCPSHPFDGRSRRNAEHAVALGCCDDAASRMVLRRQAATFKIELSRDGGATWNPLGYVETPGRRPELLLDSAGAAHFHREAQSDCAETGAMDINDADIDIASPTIEILAPAGRWRRLADDDLLQHNLGAVRGSRSTSAWTTVRSGRRWRRP